MKYIITVNQPGYLPESDPIELEVEPLEHNPFMPALVAEAHQVLEAIYDEVERNMPDPYVEELPIPGQWQELLDEIQDNIEHAADFNPRAGFLYHMPDGYVIEATYQL